MNNLHTHKQHHKHQYVVVGVHNTSDNLISKKC